MDTDFENRTVGILKNTVARKQFRYLFPVFSGIPAKRFSVFVFGIKRAQTKFRRLPNTEYRKAPFNFFSATANSERCFSTTAKREKGLYKFFAYGDSEKKVLHFFAPPQAKKTCAKTTKKNDCGEKCCVPKIVCCAARNQAQRLYLGNFFVGIFSKCTIKMTGSSAKLDQ